MSNNIPPKSPLQFECESLEDRLMLSAVEIYAAGTTNQETIELQIDGQTVATYEYLGGDADAGEFVKLTYQSETPIDSGQIRIAFTNDVFDPDNGIDRNVRIDKIVVNGETIETESADVFSTGTWKPEDGITPGFRESEILNGDGFFQYPSRSVATGSEIEIRVRGHEGTERFNLIIAGEVVGTFDATTEFQTIRFTANGTVSADDVRIEFINDDFRPDEGIDSNLTIDLSPSMEFASRPMIRPSSRPDRSCPKTASFPDLDDRKPSTAMDSSSTPAAPLAMVAQLISVSVATKVRSNSI